MDWTDVEQLHVEQTLIWFLENAALQYFLDRPYTKQTTRAKDVILSVAPQLGQSPKDFRSFFQNLLLKFAEGDPAPFRLVRPNPLAIYERITDKTTWLDFEALTFDYEEQPETYAHLQAVDPNRLTDTELLRLETYTLPKGIQCGRCSYVLALITDGANLMGSAGAASVFRKQIGLLREAFTEDHEAGHPHWRFISDFSTCVPMATGPQRIQPSTVVM